MPSFSADTDPPAATSSFPLLPPPFTHTLPRPQLLTQGAEALLYRTTFLTPTTFASSSNLSAAAAALKYRPSKPYRHPILDRRLTKHRILSEARTLVRCRREGVSVPGVLALDAEGEEGSGRGGWMLMEWIEGATVRDVLLRYSATKAKHRRELKEKQVDLVHHNHGHANGDSAGEERSTIIVHGEGGMNGKANNSGEEKEEKEEEEVDVSELMKNIGRAVGKMHSVGVIHGDLTTSNMMLRRQMSTRQAEGPGIAQSGVETKLDVVDKYYSDKKDGPDEDIVLIDFGLSNQSIQEEDQAVDLYVLERAFGSTHPEAENGFHEILQAYGAAFRGAKLVLKRLEDVRMRGRKKSMIG